MSKFLLVLLFPFAASACTSKDKWVGPDKGLHVIAGATAGAGAMSQTGDPFKGFLFGTAVGAAKELVDARGSGTCSLQDFAVTALGAAVGAYGGRWLLVHSRGTTTLAFRTTF